MIRFCLDVLIVTKQENNVFIENQKREVSLQNHVHHLLIIPQCWLHRVPNANWREIMMGKRELGMMWKLVNIN